MSCIKDVLKSVEDILKKSGYRSFDVIVAKNLNNDFFRLTIKPDNTNISQLTKEEIEDGGYTTG